jgi:rhodanese-related sulfurtransferase
MAATAHSISTQPGALEALRNAAAPRAQVPGAYAGEVTVQEAWDFVQEDMDALIVDVRTQPEWQFVGTPDLGAARERLLMISWKLYPTFASNPGFTDQLTAQGATADTPLLFLCRSGGRSLDAAIAMTQAGFRHCFNVIDGFEGEPDETRHRGTRGGWKASGLPWGQP